MDNVLQASVLPHLSSPHMICRSAATQEEDEDQELVGGYFNDGKLCWIAKESMLTVFRHASRTTIAYINFKNYLNNDVRWTVVTCKEYNGLLLVGLTSDDDKGVLCLFNHNVCKIIKAIYIPHSITSLEVILEEGGATLSSKPFAANLRWFFGVAAVGTVQGHLYLVDLRLDDTATFATTLSATIEVVPTVIRDIPKVRDAVCRRDAHLAFDILEQCHEDAEYHFVTPDDQIMKSFPAPDVAVTALHFEKRCTSLFIGFSFGQFHILDLQELALSFSSRLREFNGSVTNFVFQEPENDPKHFCYLWVVQRALDEALIESSLRGTMYQLIFENKELLKQDSSMTSLYKGLDNCTPRFQIGFDESLGLGPSIGTSKILQCCAIERYHPVARVCGEDDYSGTPYSSVFTAAWVSSRDEQQSIYVLLFDINGWYVAHMPASYRGICEDEVYVAMWSLNSAVSLSDGDLLAVCASPSSLRHFHSKIHPTPHQFSQPSSYSLQAHCLTSSKTLTCKMAGVQEQAIEYLLRNRSEALVNPVDIFERLVCVGLMEHCTGDMTSVDQKREAILSSALIHDIFAFLSYVISDLATGEYVASGCTLRFILEWAWKQASIIKDSINSLCVPIFDCSVVTLDATSQELLSRHITQLGNLHLVFKKLRQASSITQLSQLELDVKDNIIILIQGYLTVLRWFIGARLLPEQLDDHLSFELESYEEFHFVYKQKELRKVYDETRNEIKEINTSTESSLLIIDGLIDETGPDLLSRWNMADGKNTVSYPPPSLYALLSMYYLENLEEQMKHTVTTYFLLDILAVAEDTNDQLRETEEYQTSYKEHCHVVSYFPQTFQLPLSRIKLIQAFWLLDHKQFKESCWTFCEAGTERVTSAWQHRRILLAFMLQDHPEYALQYLVAQKPSTLSIDDVKLHIEILVRNRKFHHALKTAETKSDFRNREAVYSHLFASCYKHEALHDLLKLMTTHEEELLVSKYLQSSAIPHAHDILVLHHLRRSRFIDAIQLHQESKRPFIMAKHAEIEKEYHNTLNYIVQGYMSCLPDPLKDLALLSADPYKPNVASRKEAPPVQPLSAILNSSKKTAPLSQAAMLLVNMGKARNVAPPSVMTPFRKRPGQFSSPSLNRDIGSKTSKRYFSTDVVTSEKISKSSRRSMDRSVGPISLGDASESPILRRHMTSSIAKEDMDKKRSALLQSASLLLQTPPIERNRKSHLDASRIDLMTPQSILKVKLLRGKSPSMTSVSSPSSARMLTSQSSSMTSLKSDRLSSKLEFRDDALDSSGSDCETPAWMMSSMTSESKEKTPVKSFLSSRFNIATPEVRQVRKESAPASDRPSSVKKLRFRDSLSEDNLAEAKQGVILKVPSLKNVVLQETDEEQDVDVTGDVTGDVTADNVLPIVSEQGPSELNEQTPSPTSISSNQLVEEVTSDVIDDEVDGDVLPMDSQEREEMPLESEIRETQLIAASDVTGDAQEMTSDPLLTPSFPVASSMQETESFVLKLDTSSEADSAPEDEERMSVEDEPADVSSDEEVQGSILGKDIALNQLHYHLVPSQRVAGSEAGVVDTSLKVTDDAKDEIISSEIAESNSWLLQQPDASITLPLEEAHPEDEDKESLNEITDIDNKNEETTSTNMAPESLQQPELEKLEEEDTGEDGEACEDPASVLQDETSSAPQHLDDENQEKVHKEEQSQFPQLSEATDATESSSIIALRPESPPKTPPTDEQQMNDIPQPQITQSSLRRSSRKNFGTPRNEPIFILSPPITRSRSKPARGQLSTSKKKSVTTPTRKSKIVPNVSPPNFIFSPPSTIRTRSQRKRTREPPNGATKSKAPRKESPVRPVTPSTGAKTPTRSSRRLASKRDEVQSSVKKLMGQPLVPSVSEIDLTIRRSERKEKNKEAILTNQNSDVEAPPSVTRTRSGRKSRQTTTPGGMKSSQASAPSSIAAPAPSEADSDSRVAPVLSSGVASDPAPPTPDAKAEPDSRVSLPHPKPDADPVSEVAPTPSTGVSLRSRYVPPTPSSAKTTLRKIKTPRKSDSETDDVAPLARRTRSSSVSSDDVPVVTQTSSRRKRSKVTSNTETLSSVTRSHSRVINEQSTSNTSSTSQKDQSSVTSREHKSGVTDLDDIIEEDETSPIINQKVKKQKNRSRIFGNVDPSKNPGSPLHVGIRLINVSPKSIGTKPMEAA